tara:strand:- start:563 stop:1459 length:897 start_codon:yes stop_codon:yes gene_type:complete
MPEVTFPTGRFPTATGNDVVALGKVYIGEVDLDPTVLGNRIDVTIVQESGVSIVIPPASQPFVLNSGGLFTYNGSVVQLRTSQNFSMSILNSQDVQQYYFPSVVSGSSVVASGITLNAGATPSIVAGAGQVYSKTINGIVELFYLDSAGDELQITSAGELKVTLTDSAVDADSLSSVNNTYAGYYTGKVQPLTIVGGVVSLDWQNGQYFSYTNTEANTIEFSNLPAIGSGIGQSIMLAIQDAGNFGITLSPEVGYTVYVRSADNPPTYTVDGLDIFILSVYSESKITVVPLKDFEVVT